MEQQRFTTSTAAPASAPPGAAQIREQLRRVLFSPDFDMPERIGRFLSYIVEETLAGRGDRIKAYTVAVEVFGRAADFDTLNDPVVRIEAGRLRRGLERYYLLQGKVDPLLIDIPKGGYGPSFCWRGSELNGPNEPILEAVSTPRPAPSGPVLGGHKNFWLQGCVAALAISTLVLLSLVFDRATPAREYFSSRPILIVKNFENLSRNPDITDLASGLSDEILAALSSTGGAAIFSEAAPEAGGEAAAGVLGSSKRFILYGAIREAKDKVRISSRLVHGLTGEIIWSNVYDADRSSGADNEASIASKISASVSQAIQAGKAR